MSFKVVQTKENGGVKLSIVPSTWVIERSTNGGIKELALKWPNQGAVSQHKFEQMKKDATCLPMDDWPNYKCTLKRWDLTYAEALKEVGIMSGNSDTAASESENQADTFIPSSITKRMTAGERKLVAVANFRSMVCVYVYIW